MAPEIMKDLFQLEESLYVFRNDTSLQSIDDVLMNIF